MRRKRIPGTWPSFHGVTYSHFWKFCLWSVEITRGVYFCAAEHPVPFGGGRSSPWSPFLTLCSCKLQLPVLFVWTSCATFPAVSSVKIPKSDNGWKWQKQQKIPSDQSRPQLWAANEMALKAEGALWNVSISQGKCPWDWFNSLDFWPVGLFLWENRVTWGGMARIPRALCTMNEELTEAGESSVLQIIFILLHSFIHFNSVGAFPSHPIPAPARRELQLPRAPPCGRGKIRAKRSFKKVLKLTLGIRKWIVFMISNYKFLHLQFTSHPHCKCV